MRSEFELIRRHFVHPAPGTRLSVGDDCALMTPSPGQELAVSTDVLVAGRHFFDNADPYRLGRKSAAVNLSDIAAMGARPRWATLGITLSPAQDEPWVEAFARGFHDELQAHGTDWVGGDTTSGPVAMIAVTILGEVPPGQALLRSGARAGDDIWVSGTPGDAALGLHFLKESLPLSEEDRHHCLARLETPTPRVVLGLGLRGIAHAAIDVSDGLLADLGHILDASGVGASLELARMPRSAAMLRQQTLPDWPLLMLTGGDDYELCFTAAPGAAPLVQRAAAAAAVPVTQIGSVTDKGERILYDGDGHPMDMAWQGFDHFRNA
ncbi:MAG: thiamine-phosphate kinase [Betaproteobacteria bacterium]|nr:thiamine-phosphate kinase [Betaproteobacteria bacterium]